MGEHTNDLHNQISSILDKGNKEHQILSLLAKIIDVQLSHQSANIKMMQESIYTEIKEIRGDIETLTNDNIKNKEDHDKEIEQLSHAKGCPMNVPEELEEVKKRIASIETTIDIFVTIKKYKWLTILAAIGICSILGIGANEVLITIKKLYLLK